MAISTNNFSFSTFLSVDFGNSTGSGFRMNHNNVDYIVTAKHVAYKKDTLLSDLWIKSKNYFGSENDGYSAKLNLTEQNVFTIDNLDIIAIKLSQEDGYEIESSGVNISVATVDDVSRFEEISIGSSILLVGFPSSLTTDDFYDVDRPLLRTGIIAGKNLNQETFVIDAIAYYGVSGGPILQIDEQKNIKIIGIVSRFVPFITEWRNRHEPNISRQDFYNSGYAVCLPLDKIVQKIIQ